MVDHITRSRGDIFGWPLLGFLFKNPKAIMAVRLIALALFTSALVLGLIYTDSAVNPYTTAIFWSLFWPFFMIISLVLIGPAFCGICPHGFIGRYLNRTGGRKPMPSWLGHRGIGLGILIALYWVPVYLFPGLLKTPWIASGLFLILTIAAFAMYYMYKDMAYCVSVCPIGAVTKGFGKVGMVQLRTYQDACMECKSFDCSNACTHGLQPFLFEKRNSMRDCTLCMDCAQSCEAVGFHLTKPSATLFGKINDRHNAFGWVFILLLGIITITMRYHHGLGHSSIGKQLPWVQLGAWLKQTSAIAVVDWVGFAAMSFALVSTFVLVFGGFKAASMILKMPFKTFLDHCVYALAPLMLFGSLSHVGSSFFIHYYSDLANGFNWLLGINEQVKPLATFRDGWVHSFGLFGYVGALWSAVLLGARLKLLEGSVTAKAMAWLFGGAMIWFYIWLMLLQAGLRH